MAKRESRKCSKKRKNKLRSPDMEPMLSHNSNLAINRIPVEVFAIIISLVSCSRTPLAPYPQMVLSWVCRGWRSIILQDKSLWKIIYLWPKQITSRFLKVLIRRSRPADLTVLLRGPQGYSWGDVKKSLDAAFLTERFRVKTLFTQGVHIMPASLSASISTFPCLEYSFYDMKHNGSLIDKNSQCRLKRLQAVFSHIQGSNINQTLHNVQWLRLEFKVLRFDIHSLLPALQGLPNLQILHIFSRRFTLLSEDQVTFNFPNLTTLMMRGCYISRPIKASNLSYLNVCHYPRQEVATHQDDNDSDLCGFDLSTIACISVDICPPTSRTPYIMGGNQSDLIEAAESHLARCASSETAQSVLDGVFSSPASFPKDQFHFSFRPFSSNKNETSSSGFIRTHFYSCLKKSVNLVELTVNNFHSGFKPDQLDEFFNCLKDVVTLRNLTVLGATSFSVFCQYLHDGTICPRMEKLTYSGLGMTTNTSFLVPCLTNLMRERSLGCHSSLKTLELLRFSSLKYDVLQQKIGIQVIQCQFS